VETGLLLRCVRNALMTIAPDSMIGREARSNLEIARQLINLLLAEQQVLPALQGGCERRLSTLLGGSEAGEEDPLTEASRLLSRIVLSGVHDDRLSALIAALGEVPVAVQARTDELTKVLQAGDEGITRPPGEAAVAEYLARHHPRAGRAVRVEVLPGGYSRETILIETDGDGPDLVFRKVVNGRDPEWLRDEWNVLQFVAGHGLSTPQPLWYEDDAARLGNVFFAVTRMPGESRAFVLGAAGGVTPGIARNLARVLARLHSVETRGLVATPVLPMTTPEEVRRAIDSLSRPEAILPRSDAPLFEPLLDWLRMNVPPPPARPVLVHGDVGFHNILVEADEVTALLDWERSHVGDPAEELAYVRPSLAGIISWEDFLQAYVAAGGTVPSDQRMRFYTVWQDVWRASVCHDFRRRLKQEKEPRSTEAVPAYIYGPRFVAAAVRSAFGSGD
jgi:aminoglycoside phosphotransferase (APT) family kinase protein